VRIAIAVTSNQEVVAWEPVESTPCATILMVDHRLALQRMKIMGRG